MNTQQIYRILLADHLVRRTHIVQVLARDQLPTHIDYNKTAAFIINTDKSDQPGSHWVGLYFDGAFEYFDSFGLPPYHEEIISFIERNSTRPVIYNPRILQDLQSGACGLFSIHFIRVKCRRGRMSRVLLPFSAGHRQYINDRIVWRLVSPLILKTYPALSSLHRFYQLTVGI